jgi:hypothetical protein
MSVYLDTADIVWRGKTWCHLYADSLPELEAFARQIGLPPDWLQYPNGDGGFPHYDVAGHYLTKCRNAGAQHVEPGDGTYRRLRKALARGEYAL